MVRFVAELLFKPLRGARPSPFARSAEQVRKNVELEGPPLSQAMVAGATSAQQPECPRNMPRHPKHRL